ncbi:MAG: hypothetical protein V1798_10405 [Pseudomonadota bacterium]
MHKNSCIFRNGFMAALMVAFVTTCGGGDNAGFGSQRAPDLTSAVASSIPSAMKTGGLINASRLAPRSLLDVPIGSDTDAPPPSSGNILWLVWNMDYNGYCTTDKLTSGECFRVRPSTYPSSGDTWNAYYRPAALTDPTICTTDGNYDSIIGTSIVSQACRFDYNVASQGEDVDKCYDSTGQDVDMTTYIPWASDWSLPTTAKLQGSIGNSTWAMWFGLNRDVTGADGQVMVTLSNQDTMGSRLTVVDLDRVKNHIFYFDIGGKATGVQGFSAYLGDLPTSGNQSAGAFEALQVLDYNGEGSFGHEKFTIRMKSDGTYVWIQSWQLIPGDYGFEPNSSNDECLKFGATLPESTYVEPSECLTAFGKSTAEMDADDNFTLKLGVAGFDQSNWFGKGPELYDPDVNPPAPLGQCY